MKTEDKRNNGGEDIFKINFHFSLIKKQLIYIYLYFI